MKISVEKVKEWTKGFQGGVTIWIDGWGWSSIWLVYGWFINEDHV